MILKIIKRVSTYKFSIAIVTLTHSVNRSRISSYSLVVDVELNQLAKDAVDRRVLPRGTRGRQVDEQGRNGIGPALATLQRRAIHAIARHN